MSPNTNFHCNSCDNGIVVLTKELLKNGSVKIIVNECNGCNTFYGIKSITGLIKVSNLKEREVSNEI